MLRSEKDGTAAAATAPKNNQRPEAYSTSMSTSTQKFRELVANLLINLQAQSLTVRQCRHGWQFFEVVFRQYVDLRISGGQQP